jgi:hypothetical protein
MTSVRLSSAIQSLSESPAWSLAVSARGAATWRFPVKYFVYAWKRLW